MLVGHSGAINCFSLAGRVQLTCHAVRLSAQLLLRRQADTTSAITHKIQVCGSTATLLNIRISHAAACCRLSPAYVNCAHKSDANSLSGLRDAEFGAKVCSAHATLAPAENWSIHTRAMRRIHDWRL
jgi:hypothetical protein